MLSDLFSAIQVGFEDYLVMNTSEESYKIGKFNKDIMQLNLYSPELHFLICCKSVQNVVIACIGSKVGHQVESLYCHIALECPIGVIS